MKCHSKTLDDWFSNPSPPVISRDQYVPSQMTPGILGADISHIMPGAGQNAVPEPQKLYDLGSYWTPFRFLFRRPRNVLSGP